jgi:hypothetical protein
MKKEIKLDSYKDYVISHESILSFVKQNTPTLIEGQEIGWFSFGISGGKHQGRVCIYDRRMIHIDPTSVKDLELVTLEYLQLRVKTENLLRKYKIDTLSKIFTMNHELKKYRGIGNIMYKELVESIQYFLEHNEITSVNLNEIM